MQCYRCKEEVEANHWWGPKYPPVENSPLRPRTLDHVLYHSSCFEQAEHEHRLAMLEQAKQHYPERYIDASGEQWWLVSSEDVESPAKVSKGLFYLRSAHPGDILPDIHWGYTAQVDELERKG